MSRKRRAKKTPGLAWRQAKGPPLLRGEDQGAPVTIDPKALQIGGTSWIDPFLVANEHLFRRLDLAPRVRPSPGGVKLQLQPGSRIGAIPLLSPSTRRPCAGLVIRPRFPWSSVGQVFQAVGFSVVPRVGEAPLVPGSALEVPTWLLAGPVLRRMQALLAHLPRTFHPTSEVRSCPRGTVNWGAYARTSIPTGRWHTFECTFPDLQQDPWLLAGVRWTLERVVHQLGAVASTPLGRILLKDAKELLSAAGEGSSLRPHARQIQRASRLSLSSQSVGEALQAMDWVSEDRGLGGQRSLQGLTWDLAVDQLWEAWVEAFLRDLAPKIGFRLSNRGQNRRRVRWNTPLQTLGSLEPDLVLERTGHAVFVDAKYKSHLALLQQKRWLAFPEELRAAHRADFHQALAYASLSSAKQVDTILAYPVPADLEGPPPMAVAEVKTGQRNVRLLLAGVPFGFKTRASTTGASDAWKQAIRGSAE